MKKFVNSLIIAGVILGSTVSFAAPPSWYTEEQKDTASAFYGVGEGETSEEATKAALNDIASKIAVTVQSKYKSEQKLNNAEYSNIAENTIVANVKKMKFNNYQVAKKTSSGDTYYALVKVDRMLLADEKTTELDSAAQKLESEYSEAMQSSELERLKKLIVMEDEISAMNEKTFLLKSISPSSDASKYVKLYDKLTSAFVKTKSAISINIAAQNDIAKNYVKVFAKKISAKGLKVGGGKASGTLLLSATAKDKKVESTNEAISKASFAAVELTLTLKDSRGNEIASNIIRFTNNSTVSYADALGKTQRLDKYLSENDIYNVIFSIEPKQDDNQQKE